MHRSPPTPATTLAALALGALVSASGCALVDAFTGSGDLDTGADSGPLCNDPLGPPCPTFTCDDPFGLGAVEPALFVDIDTCVAASVSSTSLCGFPGPKQTLVMSFELSNDLPHQICINGPPGQTIAAMDSCDPTGRNGFACVNAGSCSDVFPLGAGRKFLIWENLDGGQCGNITVEITPSNIGIPDAGVPDGAGGGGGGAPPIGT